MSGRVAAVVVSEQFLAQVDMLQGALLGRCLGLPGGDLRFVPPLEFGCGELR